jgi:hypothetical protein
MLLEDGRIGALIWRMPDKEVLMRLTHWRRSSSFTVPFVVAAGVSALRSATTPLPQRARSRFNKP